MANGLLNLAGVLGTLVSETTGATLSNAVFRPVSSAVGASLAGVSGALSGSIWAASELAKFGKKVGGRPGEISGALVALAPGAMAGFLIGSLLGTLSGKNMVEFYFPTLARIGVTSSQANGISLPGKHPVSIPAGIAERTL